MVHALIKVSYKNLGIKFKTFIKVFTSRYSKAKDCPCQTNSLIK